MPIPDSPRITKVMCKYVMIILERAVPVIIRVLGGQSGLRS